MRVWRAVRSFWAGEEVPRWFGLSVVLTYLAGLGSVARVGIVTAHREARTDTSRVTRLALEFLADRLSLVDPAGAGSNGAYRRALREFATDVPTNSLRIVDAQGKVITAFDGLEAGADGQGESKESIRVSFVPTEAGSVEGPLYLEANLAANTGDRSSLSSQAGALTIVLIVLGVLFVLYRCLRLELRPVSRIAERLRSRHDRLEDDLASLRIGDAIDGVTHAWNQLIELTQNMADTVQRTHANEELSKVLKQSAGGALAEVLNAVPDGLIYVTDETRIEYLNASAGRLLGWNVQDGERQSLKEARASGVGGRILDLLRDALLPSGVYEARSTLLESGQESGGDPSCYRVWVIPLNRAHQQGECVTVIRDVSQQVRAERSREEFVTQVTHELRTPLTNIRAYAETLSSGMFDDPKVITECYNVITKETRRLSRLIEDVLSVAQFEVGSLELRLDQVDLRTLLTESVRDVRGLADEKNVDIQLVLPAKMDPIRADRDKLAVVVNNLLGNAIKYTRADGNVVVGCQYAPDAVVFTVKDNGIGIDPADQQRIFEKFQRGSSPEALSETGSGIGLYTAREIVRGHGGDIELISHKGQGSTFLIRLPHQESRAIALTTTGEA